MSKQQFKKKRRILLKGQDKYNKIEYRQKMFLLKGVFIDKAQIKETSERLGINYSTAKTFLRKFKTRKVSLNIDFISDVCNWFEKHFETNQRCSYKFVGTESLEMSSAECFSQLVKKQQEGEDLNSCFSQKRQNDSLKPGQIEIVQQVLFKNYS